MVYWYVKWFDNKTMLRKDLYTREEIFRIFEFLTFNILILE